MEPLNFIITLIRTLNLINFKSIQYDKSIIHLHIYILVTGLDQVYHLSLCNRCINHTGFLLDKPSSNSLTFVEIHFLNKMIYSLFTEKQLSGLQLPSCILVTGLEHVSSLLQLVINVSHQKQICFLIGLLHYGTFISKIL